MLHIRVVEGDGAIHSAGVRSTRGLVVEITDETGKPVNGAAVSFRLPEEGPGGTFARGLRTEIAITTPDGRASVYEMITGRVSGPFQVRVTAVHDQVRAGTVVDQYVSDAPVKSTGKGNTVLARKGSNRWILWTAIAGGAAAAGLAAGMARGSKASTGPAAPATPPGIGAPVITIGSPK